MAGNIKGITIELAGDTTKLDKALKDVNDTSRDLQKELKQIDQALKFNPGNADLIAQKQRVLAESIENTGKKLDTLKEASRQAEAQLANGNLGQSEFDALQREIIKTENQLGRFENSLRSIDGQSLDDVADSATNAETNISQMGEGLVDIAKSAGVHEAISSLIDSLSQAAGKLNEVIQAALEQDTLDTKIEITMDLDEEGTQAVKEGINIVKSYGVDGEAALDGVRKQWQLNADASDEANQKIVAGAGVIASAYDGVDFSELIQETNEIGSALGISDEEALALTNSLLAMGFPPDQIDIIAEYGTQLSQAGYSAEEVQAIMAAGVETGTWNIDNLLDGLKEGRIKLAEFGQSVPDATSELLSQTSISTEQLQQWGQAIAQGGEGGTKAMQEVAQALVAIEDPTLRNALGVQFFGTMWEDQGTNITDTILGMNEQMTTTASNQDAMNSAIASMDASPAVQLQQAMTELKTASQPIMEVIAGIVSKVAEWMSNNPTLATGIMVIIGVLGILIPIITALGLLFTSLSVAAGALGISVGALLAPILIIIAIIAALIAIGVALYQNWDTIKAKASELASAASAKFNEIKSNITNAVNNARTAASTAFEGIKSDISSKIDAAKEKVRSAVDAIKNFFSNLKLKLPKIDLPPLPHFSLSGSFSLNPPSVPKLSVDWYDKGGIFYGPQVIGVDSQPGCRVIDFIKQTVNSVKVKLFSKRYGII